MELHPSIPTIVGITFFVISIAFIFYIKRARRGEKREPPQAKGAWPIIGHLHLLGGSNLPYKVLGDMSDKYGSIFTIKLGIHQVLVVSNSEVAKDCFTTNDKVLASRPKAEATKILTNNYAFLGFTPYGEYWRQVRKIIMLEVLSQRRVEMLGGIRVSEVRASIKDIYDAWVEKNESEKSGTVKVEMDQWFGNLMLNIMIRIISGKRLSPNDEERVRFQGVVRKFVDLIGVFVVSDYIPYLKCLDVGGYFNVMKKIRDDLDDIFEGWLKEHKAESEYIPQHEGSQAFIHVLVSALQGASEEDFPGYDHDTIIKATCKPRAFGVNATPQQLLIAGLDTTSVTLTWALSLLLNNPKSLKIIQDEIDEHVGRDRPVEESDLKNLIYLDAAIKETLRLYPVAPLSIPHESTEDCIVGGYNIPKGTRVLVNLSKIQRDPNIWSDPSEFRPERFLTCHKDIDVKGKHFELLPFGSGRRMCPGILFALQSLGLTLATLIQHFVLQKPSNELIDTSETPGLINNKATPLMVLISPRLSSNMYHVSS